MSNENTKNFIDQLSVNNNVEAGEAFKDALRGKVADALDNQRKEIASNMFNGTVEAQSFSDPKPEIADPGTFNPDGSISTTTSSGNDGQVEMDLTQGNEDAGEQNS
jgi:hypothetical protein|tara:strand:- start:2596 stop:2913 length:318 start_codon:yes stop_codon:yes gene_type:complete